MCELSRKRTVQFERVQPKNIIKKIWYFFLFQCFKKFKKYSDEITCSRHSSASCLGVFLLFCIDRKKQVIVVSLPGKSDFQYRGYLRDIADFGFEMDTKTDGRDHLFIIHDKSGRAYLKHHTFTNAHLIEVDQFLDLWMRDYPPCMPNQQIKFKYRPQYISKAQAKFDEGLQE